ncbi:hypothetical protein [Pacificispira sp.]|uniref:hypothetical protein n=1 Tax=Pacificispira sp. TaxID=2888761 RepID=UPI003BACF65B
MLDQELVVEGSGLVRPRIATVLLAFGCLVALSACQTTKTGDPCDYRGETQGFLGATGSVLTDQYEACTAKLIAQLEELQLANIQAKRRAERLEALAAESEGDVADAAARLARVNRDSQTALDRLNEMRARRNADQAKLDDLLAQQRALEDKKRALSEAALSTDGTAESLQAEIAALEQEQAALLEIIEAESQA